MSSMTTVRATHSGSAPPDGGSQIDGEGVVGAADDEINPWVGGFVEALTVEEFADLGIEGSRAEWRSARRCSRGRSTRRRSRVARW